MKRSYPIIALLLALLLSIGGVLAQDANPTPSPDITPTPTVPLSVWLPDMLAIPESAADLILRDQINAFQVETGLQVEARLKLVGEVGGVMSSMRTAAPVAPGALPDVTLLRRRDLVSAVQLDLIQPLERFVPSAIQGDWNNALQLGQVDDTLYGAPAVLDLWHLVYRTDAIADAAEWDFDSVLSRNDPLIFPGGASGNLNGVFYAQYRAAGAALNGEGALTLNPGALRTVLEFYEAASDNGLVDGNVLNFTSLGDYLPAFEAGEVDIALLNTTTYLQMLENDPRLRHAPIPTPQGEPLSLMDGWAWVLVTTDPERQQDAMRFILWMLDTERQSVYTRTIAALPARQSALTASLPASLREADYGTLLQNAVLPPTEDRSGPLDTAIQGAFVSVITTEKTAQEAADTVLSAQAEATP